MGDCGYELLPAHKSGHTTCSNKNFDFRHVFSINKGITLAGKAISTNASG